MADTKALSEKVIKFYRTKDPYGAFSNFSRHAVFVAGKIWPTVEHYYQAAKFACENRQEKIRLAKSPIKAAQMGRDRNHPVHASWDDKWRIPIMHRALLAKFSQHPDLKDLLLGTGDALLVEDSPTDYFWGWGKERTGKNMLGNLLMDVRNSLRKEED